MCWPTIWIAWSLLHDCCYLDAAWLLHAASGLQHDQQVLHDGGMSPMQGLAPAAAVGQAT
jgi:hypothetical protein